MVTALRYTPQKQQELRSRHQLSERLTEFGWLPIAPEDLGEDFIVHIYHEGRATGVNFYVQLKSVTNLNGRRKGDYLPYPFEVKDLVHWEQFALPIVLIVWDVKLRQGRWAMLSDVIQQLDQHYPNWRDQKTKTVHLPWQNSTNEDGLVKLRKVIGQKLYSLISKGKPQDVRLKFTFNIQNKDDKRNWEKFNYFLDSGKEVTLNNTSVQFDYPKWQQYWLELPEFDKWDFTLGPRVSSIVHKVDISVTDKTGDFVYLPTTEFEVIFGGKSMTMSNEHQTRNPVHFHISFEDLNLESEKFEKTTIIFEQNNLGSNVYQALDILKFRQALAEGGSLRLTFQDRGNRSLPPFIIDPQPDLIPNPEVVDLVQKLCLIQKHTGKFISLPQNEILKEDAEIIHKMAEIIETGKVISYYDEVKVNGFQKEGLEIVLKFVKENPRIKLQATYEGIKLELFGDDFHFGPLTRHVIGNIQKTTSEFEQMINELNVNEIALFSLLDVEMIDIYPGSFKTKARRITELLAERFQFETLYLFGSLVWNENWKPETDIDLAIHGLEPKNLFKAIEFLEGETQFPFDLIDLDEVPISLRERILTEGELLYER